VNTTLRRSASLEICQQRLVLLVRTDPKPNNYIIGLEKPNHAIASTYSSGKDRLRFVNSLKEETAMVRIHHEDPVRDSRLFADIFG